jgi:orotidine-5'-phosphate decarboxylase
MTLCDDAPLVPAPAEKQSDARERLIVALDFQTSAEALALVDTLKGSCQWYKVGLELFLSAGNGIIHMLKERGFSVFLDLKLHDIPNTVAGAIRSLSAFGADLLTVHAAGGEAMLRAAAEAAAGIPDAPKLLAVTVLTSMDLEQLSGIGVGASPREQVLRLARMGWSAGIHGFVCSPEEARAMRSELGGAAILATPGIRPAGSAVGDQKRIATPAAAIAAGANYLVVGRPITQAADPLAAAESILAEITSAME